MTPSDDMEAMFRNLDAIAEKVKTYDEATLHSRRAALQQLGKSPDRPDGLNIDELTELTAVLQKLRLGTKAGPPSDKTVKKRAAALAPLPDL